MFKVSVFAEVTMFTFANVSIRLGKISSRQKVRCPLIADFLKLQRLSEVCLIFCYSLAAGPYNTMCSQSYVANLCSQYLTRINKNQITFTENPLFISSSKAVLLLSIMMCDGCFPLLSSFAGEPDLPYKMVFNKSQFQLSK